MSANQADFPVAVMARVLGVSKAGYYAWRDRPPSARAEADAALLKRVRTIHASSRQTYGAPRVQAELRASDERHGRKRIARLMREAGLGGACHRGGGPPTTRRDRDAKPAPDLVDRKFKADLPDQLWVADITYLPTITGFLYLAIVLDAFSRKIVGWSMANHLRTTLIVDALDIAVGQRRPKDVIHHSDQGSQGGFKQWSPDPKSATVGEARNTVALSGFQQFVQSLGRCSPAEGFTGPRVEGARHSREGIGAVQAQVGALREILAQQPVGVLVGAALPRAAAVWNTGPSTRNGMQTGPPVARSWRSWRSTPRCGVTCRIACPARSSPRAGRRATSNFTAEAGRRRRVGMTG